MESFRHNCGYFSIRLLYLLCFLVVSLFSTVVRSELPSRYGLLAFYPLFALCLLVCEFNLRVRSSCVFSAQPCPHSFFIAVLPLTRPSFVLDHACFQAVHIFALPYV